MAAPKAKKRSVWQRCAQANCVHGARIKASIGEAGGVPKGIGPWHRAPPVDGAAAFFCRYCPGRAGGPDRTCKWATDARVNCAVCRPDGQGDHAAGPGLPAAVSSCAPVGGASGVLAVTARPMPPRPEPPGPGGAQHGGLVVALRPAGPPLLPQQPPPPLGVHDERPRAAADAAPAAAATPAYVPAAAAVPRVLPSTQETRHAMDGGAGPKVQAFLQKHELETQRQLPSWEETLKSDVRRESAAEIAALTSQVAKLQAENAALRSATTAAQKVSEDLQVRGSQTSCAHGQR